MAMKRAAAPAEPENNTKVPKPSPKEKSKAPMKVDPQAAALAPSNIVPVGAPRVASATASASSAAKQEEVPPAMPKLCFTGDGHVISNMRHVIPYVTGHVRHALKNRDEFKKYFLDVAPYLHQPLAIQADDKLNADTVTSYKPPWTNTDAKTSLESTGMFEAAGNVLWVCPYPPTDDGGKIIAGEVGGWSDVTEIAETCFSAEAYQTTHATSQGSVAHITFPVLLAVYAEKVTHVLINAFPSSLALLTGHVYVYAWYWAMFEAINNKNYGLPLRDHPVPRWDERE
jgi:hypothetical protein